MQHFEVGDLSLPKRFLTPFPSLDNGETLSMRMIEGRVHSI